MGFSVFARAITGKGLLSLTLLCSQSVQASKCAKATTEHLGVSILKSMGNTYAHTLHAAFFPYTLPAKFLLDLARAVREKRLPASIRDAIQSGKIQAFRYLRENGVQGVAFFVVTAFGYHPILLIEDESGTPEDEIFAEAEIERDNKNQKNILYISLHDPKTPDDEMAGLGFAYRFMSNKNAVFRHAKNYDSILAEIAEYRATHGPLDDLIIDSHGFPAGIVAKLKSIRSGEVKSKTMVDFFNPSAKVIVNTCYTGTSTFSEDGTEFLTALGNSLLSKGGKVYAFRRISQFTPPENMSPEDSQQYTLAQAGPSTFVPGKFDIDNLGDFKPFLQQQVRRLMTPEKFNVVEIKPRQ